MLKVFKKIKLVVKAICGRKKLTAQRIPRDKHNVSRDNISVYALKVLYRLRKHKFKACLVGGGVRDLLLNQTPKDFDVVTDATPHEIHKIFKNCRLIGRRFRLAHIYFGKNIVEVATFRAAHKSNSKHGKKTKHGVLLRDNIYGDINDDVLRRDFTVNALYYDINDFCIIDYVDGFQDLKHKKLRIIGDPARRFIEDPVRILRAIRFMCKLDFALDQATAEQLSVKAHLLTSIAPARLFEEYSKLFLHGHACKTFFALQDFDLLKYLFANYEQVESKTINTNFISCGLEKVDKMVLSKQEFVRSWPLAVILWGFVKKRLKALYTLEELKKVMQQVIHVLRSRLIGPYCVFEELYSIWELQVYLEFLTIENVKFVFHSKNFKLAYDFFLLRSMHEGNKLKHTACWWSKFISTKEARNKMLEQLNINV